MSSKNIIIGKNIPLKWKKIITFNNIEHKNCFTNLVSNSNFIQGLLLLNPFLFSYRKNEFFITDYLIVGDNPFLNISLLKKISEKHNNFDEKIKVVILDQSETDYWGYHIIKNYNEEIEKFKNMLLTIKFDGLEVYVINSNLEYDYHHEFKEGFVIFLSKSEKVKGYFPSIFPNIFISVDNIKKEFKYIFNNLLKKMSNMNQIMFNKKNPILISKKIFFTTFNRKLNYEMKIKELKYNENKFLINYFENKTNAICLGSAEHIPENFFNFNDLVCHDLKKINDMNIT